MTTQEFQSQIIDACKRESACEGQFKLLLAAKDSPALFLSILRHNHGWCVEKGIYTPELLLQLDSELLYRGGYATHDTKPVSFDEPVKVGGSLWAPFNHGASLDNINGDYRDFDETSSLVLDGSLRVPSVAEHTALAGAPTMWGIYANSFGRVFEGWGDRLFFPASGYRNGSDGAIYNVGANGYYWSESVYDAASGYYLHFYSGSVHPQGAGYRRNGFPVRCVQ